MNKTVITVTILSSDDLPQDIPEALMTMLDNDDRLARATVSTGETELLDGNYCPLCGSNDVANEGPEPEITCHDCGFQFDLEAGTTRHEMQGANDDDHGAGA